MAVESVIAIFAYPFLSLLLRFFWPERPVEGYDCFMKF